MAVACPAMRAVTPRGARAAPHRSSVGAELAHGHVRSLMSMFRSGRLAFALALAAAAAVRAQTPPAPAPHGSRAAGAAPGTRRRRPRGAAAAPRRPRPSRCPNRRRPPSPMPRRQARGARPRSRRALGWSSAVSRSRGRRGCRRPGRGRSSTPSPRASRSRAARRWSSRRPISITSRPSPAGRRRTPGCRTTSGGADHPRRLPPAVGDELPRRPVHRGQGLRLPQWRRRASWSSTTWRSASGSRSSTTRAASSSSRRRSTRSCRKRTSPSASTRSSTTRSSAASRSIIRGMLSEKGYLDSKVTHEIKPMAGRPKTVNVTFNIVDGPEVQDPQDRLRRQQGDRRRHAQAEDEGDEGAVVPSRSSPAAASTRKTSTQKTPRRSSGLLPRQGLPRDAASSNPEVRTHRGHEGRQHALRRAA